MQDTLRKQINTLSSIIRIITNIFTQERKFKSPLALLIKMGRKWFHVYGSHLTTSFFLIIQDMVDHKNNLVFDSLELSCRVELYSCPVWYAQGGLEDFLLIRHAQKQEA